LVADIQMPGMPGIELKNARAADALPTPVIIITALAGDQWLVAEPSGAAFCASRSVRRRCSVW
jgi:FixJ family two-component response regulator